MHSADTSVTLNCLAYALRRSAERWHNVRFEPVQECVYHLVHRGVLQKSNDIPGPGLRVTSLVATQDVDEILRTRAEGNNGLQ